jgi:DNA-binding LacI/PurR family transcriptional regulator
VTIRLIDVARLAGVSRSTASNVFNSPELVRPELRERVNAAAAELGYLGPDARGRLLRAGKFNTIGVMAPADWGVADAMGNPVFIQFLRGVAEACDQTGSSMLLVPNGTSSQGINGALADGFIFGRVEHLQQIEPARLRRSPFAVVDFDPGPETNAVWVDSRAGAYDAARHLLDLGHRRFAIMSFLREKAANRLYAPGQDRPPAAAGMPTDQEKYDGYADALRKSGIDIMNVPMLQANQDDPSAAARLLDSAPEATAILSMSVMQGLAIITEAQRRGLAVPRDLSVIAYNDIPEAATASPALTTVDGMGMEKGRIAARLVLETGKARQVVLKPRLLLRASTAPAPQPR